MFAHFTTRQLPRAVSIVLALASGTASDSAHADGVDGSATAALDRCLDQNLPLAAALAACSQAEPWTNRLDTGQRAALLHRRGAIALVQGRRELALELLLRAHKAEPTVAPFLLTLGDALLADGQFDQAMIAYRKGWELAPTSAVFGARLEASAFQTVAGVSGRPEP